MYTIKNDVQTEQIINKSRFITYLYKVASEEEAREKLKEIRKKHYDATHNCYSYIIGRDAEISKFSDDGEPSGTAGVVIYDVLLKNNLTNILAIVTRYYGGIKLGAGGLVRAYSSSTAIAVDAAEIEEIIDYIHLSLTVDYSILGLVEKYISDYEVLSKDFGANITIIIKVPELESQDLQAELIDISKNTILINQIEN